MHFLGAYYTTMLQPSEILYLFHLHHMENV